MNHVFSVIRNFLQGPRVSRAVRLRAGKSEQFAIARSIYETHLKHIRPFRAAIPFFLNVCWTVDEWKCRAIGKNAPTDISNNIQTAVGQFLLLDSEWDESDVDWLNEAYSHFTSANQAVSRWGATKLAIMLNAMVHIQKTREFARNVRFAPTPEQLRMIEAEYETTERHIKETMERLMELRRYGVKSSFTRRWLPPNDDTAWVFWDIRDFTKPLGISIADCVAEVAFATAASQIKDLRLTPSRKEHTDNLGYTLPFPAAFTWSMTKQADFQIGMHHGVIQVGDLFRREGKELAFQAVRLQMMYHLYDLIVPVAKLAALPDFPEQIAPGRLAKIKAALGLLEKDPVANLLLPRMRLLENPAELVNELEREIEEGQAETERRALRRHEVINHIRRLPPGHHPSALARQRAFEEIGIELADNETYVRLHERGSGERITAHRAQHVARA